MTEWRTPLREALGSDDDTRLSTEEVQAMRRAVIAAVPPLPPADWGFSWRRPLAVCAALMLMLLTGVVGGRRLPVRVAGPVDPVPVRADGGGERRQLQFSTPGGTRIIWTFDPDFKLHEVMP
jgi:hypothetical protein